MARVRARQAELDIDAVLLSVGPDLPYLTGYEAMPLERLTMLVLPVDGDATLVVPRLEAPRVVERSEVFSVRSWDETDDPIAIVARAGRRVNAVAIGDRTWARFVIDLQHALPSTVFTRGSEVMGPLRARKDAAEIEALRRAGAAADRVATGLQTGDIELAGRTEAQVSAELGRRLRAEGHHRVNFAIVAAGANAASPHHEPGDTVIGEGEVVLCDFGGTMLGDDGIGYCSDITRCVHLGEPSEEMAEVYAVLLDAQQAAVSAAVVGTPCQEVDATARADHHRGRLGRAVHPPHRPRHRHRGARRPLHRVGQRHAARTGHAFSIEPGIYVAGRFGFRLEDIVVRPTSPVPIR